MIYHLLFFFIKVRRSVFSSQVIKNPTDRNVRRSWMIVIGLHQASLYYKYRTLNDKQPQPGPVSTWLTGPVLEHWNGLIWFGGWHQTSASYTAQPLLCLMSATLQRKDYDTDQSIFKGRKTLQRGPWKSLKLCKRKCNAKALWCLTLPLR